MQEFRLDVYSVIPLILPKNESKRQLFRVKEEKKKANISSNACFCKLILWAENGILAGRFKVNYSIT